MNPKNAKKDLENRIQQIGKSTADLLPAEGVRLMLDFYREVRADGCKGPDQNGDMLLVQWGNYDWGQGPSFQFDLTRQFIVDSQVNADNDDVIAQLSLRFHFPPSTSLHAIKSGNRWCQAPEELDNFEAFIASHEAYLAARDCRAAKVVLHFQDGGL
jgi:hypothetical protein